jgi:hypothetical protein
MKWKHNPIYRDPKENKHYIVKHHHYTLTVDDFNGKVSWSVLSGSMGLAYGKSNSIEEGKRDVVAALNKMLQEMIIESE